MRDPNDLEVLEAMVNRASIVDVLAQLAQVCSEKGDAIQQRWIENIANMGPNDVVVSGIESELRLAAQWHRISDSVLTLSTALKGRRS